MVEYSSERPRRHRREVDDISEKNEVEEIESPEKVESEVKELDDTIDDVGLRVQDAMTELKARESREEKISQGLEEAIGELREMESRKETTESKIKEALEEIENPVHDTELQAEGESKYDDLREGGGKSEPKEEFEELVPDSKDRLESKEEVKEIKESINDAEPELEENLSNKDGAAPEDSGTRFREIHTQEEFDSAQDRYADIESRGTYEDQLDEPKKHFEDIEEGMDTPKPNLVEEIEIEAIEDSEGREKERLNEVPQERENRFRVETVQDVDKLSELDLGNQDGTVRCGTIEDKMYVWTPDDSPTQLENIYSDLYYYFRDKESFDQYIRDVGDSLEIPTQNRNELEKVLHELASQMLTEPVDENCINTRTKRIRGDYVHLMNDISGKTLKDIEGDISRVTGQNGHGGIENPRFPHGEKLEVSVARMAGTVMSDCTIEPNGVIKYAESDKSRIRIVVENLREFGDINPSSTHIESENHYITHIPFVMGKIMMQRGVPSGDRTIQNPGLITSVREGSDRVQRAYTEDFITQDGCVGDKSVVWRRANALDAGKKSEKYNFEPKVGVKEIELIIDEGRKEEGNATGWALSWGTLNDLAESSDNRISRTANDLQRIVLDNPNKLIHDEVDVVRDLGVNVEVKPSEIKYYPESGRVTTIWQAHTTGEKEAIKLGIAAPPNDVIKKEKMKCMIEDNPAKTEEAMSELRKNNIEFELWWE
ncbi:hypothetical protein E4H12_04225 [Candidatus Thorarchaeota archaeon]|nr:MAG: hypothetical protein E4H12_04225 [Candidatus Thorarchaeota archaeon]